MIGIKVGGMWLDLQGTKVRLHADSQLFTREFVQNWYTYPINLPKTPTNANAMRHYDNVASNADLDDIPCEIHLEGLFFRAGAIAYRGFRDGKYDIDIKVPPDPIITALSERLISSFDYTGPFSFAHSPDFDADGFNNIFDSYQGTVDSVPFTFAPIRNTRKFGDREENYFNAIAGVSPNADVEPPHNYLNYFDGSLPQPWIRYTNDASITFWTNDYTPLPYLAWIAEGIFKDFGWALAGDVFADPEVRTQVILSNAYMLMGAQTVGGVLASIDNDGYDSLALGTCLPEMTCIEFLRAIMGRYCAAIVWDGQNVVRIRSMNAVLADTDFWDITDLVDGAPVQKIDRPVAVNLVPEEETRQDPPLENPEFDVARLLATVATYGDLSGLTPVVGDFALVQQNNKVYQYRFTTSGNAWVAHSDYIYAYEEAQDAEDISAGVALTAMYSGPDEVHGSREWLVPEVFIPISDHMGNWHGVGVRDVKKLRLLFNRGVGVDSNAESYPLLSTETLAYDGSAVPDATMAERIEGSNGIYQTWYARWRTALRRSRSVQVRARVPLHKLLNFDFSRKVRINGTDYLTLSYDVEVTTKGSGTVLLDLMSV